MKKVLLFDLDGTLIDSAEGIYLSLLDVLAQEGLPPIPREDVRYFMGTSIPTVLERRYGISPERGERVLKTFMSHYPAHNLGYTYPIPGAAAMLRRLRERGHRLAVASCKPWAYCGDTLDVCGYQDCFDAVAGSYHNGVPEEKSAVIGDALRQLEVPAALAVMVGDRASDVEGAAQWNIPCVGVEFCGYADPGELERAGAVAVVQTVEQLEAVLTAL